MHQTMKELFAHPNITLLDGAMGTMLQSAGLPAGYPPELWNLEKPEVITDVARRYLAVGSRVLYANTFGANRHKLEGADVGAVVAAGVAAAKRAAEGSDALVALDVGPIGRLLEPLGDLPFDDAYETFREVVTAGEAAGADLVVFETMSDLYEVKAAVLAAKENTALPVWVTMTFEENARTFVGVTVPSMALTLTGLGVDALGFNCSLGPRELLPMAQTLAQWTSLPIILKPNAGLPDPATGGYRMTPDEFARELAPALEQGTAILGGCCGTTPEFIAALARELRGKSPAPRAPRKFFGVCSATRAVPLDGVRVVGERINPTGKKRFQRALRELDIPYVLARGVEQQDAGADILDVNVGLPGLDEPAVMKRVVRELQAVVELPLQIDSSDTEAIEAGLRYYNGKPIVNSVNGEQKKLDAILPLCKKYGAAVVGLTMDERGIPETAEARVEIAKRIVDAALSYGIPREDIYIDCLVLTVSAQQEQARETLRAVRRVTGEMGLHAALGISNIAFGLPAREPVTLAFLHEALAAGVILPFINPNEPSMMDAIFAHRVLSGQDVGCERYIARFSEQDSAVPTAPVAADMTVEAAVLKGLRDETAALVRRALEGSDELTVVNDLLIPALDVVGDRYKRGKLFLPQLINAANAANEGFEVIRARLADKGADTVSRGKIVVATVEGDIHDIGKNIVKMVLENYGYTVIDLGRSVPPEAVVEAVVRENVSLVGLSALMTTTVPAMKRTVRALRECGHDCKVWVGGAVLTPAYALEIGADFYAKDAKQSVDIARAVLG